MPAILEPLQFSRGPSMANRFFLAPLTNTQSHKDGTLSDDEFHWLTKRAEGGFGMTMTCAAHVQAGGKGFPGQLGVWKDDHLPGLTRLAIKIKSHGSMAICQLHHAGMRSPREEIEGDPLCPSDNERTGARALTLAETQQVVEDFVKAAVRAQNAGFDGVELHGAHGYLLCQFFSSVINRRNDDYGGSLENRYRILFEIIAGIREQCREDFVLGVRLSPERFGLNFGEQLEMAGKLLTDDRIDFLDMSLWNCHGEPVDEAFAGKTLLQHFVELPRGSTKLGVAGNIRTPEQVEQIMAGGVDWLMLGRAAMLHHNFPQLYRDNPRFTPVATPASADHLAAEGLSEKFIAYAHGNWPDYFGGR